MLLCMMTGKVLDVKNLWWPRPGHALAQLGRGHAQEDQQEDIEGASGESFLKIGVLPKEGLLALVGSIGKHTQSFQIIQKHSSTYLPPCVMNGIFLNDGRAGFVFFVFF